MVGIVTGPGLGLERGSGNVLGSRGQLGSAGMGRAGEGVYINAGTGNLILSNRDEFLIGRGPDSIFNRTYNSKGLANDDNGDNWRLNVQRKVVLTSGTAGSSGTLTQTDWDGSERTYTWNAAGYYENQDGDGAYDRITYDSGNNRWIWTDGSSRITDTYDNANGGRLISSKDLDGNTISYTYTSGKLTRVTTADGNYTDLSWSGNNLTSLATTYTDPQGATKTLTRTRYTYDGSNRLTSVSTDLSPEDNSVTDARTYTTSYTYDGSNRVTTITQTDGSQLSFTYDGSSRIASFTETVETGVTRTTTFTYNSDHTAIYDPAGNETLVYTDSAGQLFGFVESTTGGDKHLISTFAYDTKGNVTQATRYEGYANYINGIFFERDHYTYDTNTGNLTEVHKRLSSAAYELTRWTYGSNNEVLTETRFTGLDTDGPGGTDPSGGMTTYYIYDTENHLRFAISAENRVTEYRYTTAGEVSSTIAYTGTLYSSSTYTESALATWVSSTADRTKTSRVDTAYDFRGNITTVTSWPMTDSSGNGTGTYSRTTHVYDQAGRLLSKLINDGSQAETFAYDGMGRTIRHTDAKGIGTWFTFADTQARVITTHANGLTQTSAFNKAGELISSIEARGGVTGENLAGDLSAWTQTNVSASAAGTIDGAPATRYELTSAGGGHIRPSTVAVNAGDTLTSTVSLQATSTGNSAALGIYGPTLAWGDYNASSARIISGPGTLEHNAGGYWKVTGLSQTEPTRVEITRLFTGSDTVDVRIYPSQPTGYAVGNAIIVSAPSVVHSRYDTSTSGGSFDPAHFQMSNWGTVNVTATSAGTLSDGAAAMQYLIADPNFYLVSNYFTAQAGDTITTSVTLKGASGGTSASLGIWNDSSVWGGGHANWGGAHNGLSTARIVSGPGTLVQANGGLWSITGLSASQETRIEVSRTFAETSTGAIYLYPDSPAGAVTGRGVIAGSPAIVKTLGTQTNYKYDNLGRLRIKTDPVGMKTFYFYDARSRLIGEVDSDGSVVEYKYDAAGREVARTAYATALNSTQVASLFDYYGNPTSVTFASIRPSANAADRWNWNIYDQMGRLIETIDYVKTDSSPIGAVTTFAYDGASRLIKTTRYSATLSNTAVEGFKTTTPTTLQLPTANATNDRTVRSFYDNDGLLTATLDEEGYLTEYLYDKAGRQIETIGYATLTSSTHWASGSLTQLRPATNGADIHNYTLYDGRSLVMATVDGEGNITRYTYDARGNVTKEERGYKGTASTQYTLANLPTTLGADNLLEVTDYAYDVRGQLITRIRNLSGTNQKETTSYVYNAMGQLVSETVSETVSSETRTATNRYDARGRLIARLSGEGSAALAALSNPTQAQIDALYATRATRYVYDAADRIIQMITPDGSGATGNKTLYYYDTDGQLRFEINALGEVTEQRYTVFEGKSDVIIYGTRLSSGTLATLNGGLVNSTVTTAVSAVANALSDSKTQYAYNVQGQLASVTDALSAVTSLSYNSFGQLADTTATPQVGQTNKTEYSYDRRGLTTVVRQLLNGSSTGAIRIATSYDAFGRTISVNPTTTDSRAQSFGYDRANRLTSQTDMMGATTTLTYNPRGNVISSTDRTGRVTTYAHDLFSRTVTTTLASVVSSVKVNAYGQTIEIKDGSNRTTTYTYDKDGNLKTAADAAGTVTNSYDTAGRLYEVTDERGTKTRYAYDAVNRVLSEIRDHGSGTLNLTTTYTYDAKGQAVTVTEPTGRVTEFKYDLKGQKTEVIEAKGTSVERKTIYVYRADGKVTQITEAVGSSAERVTAYSYDSMGRLVEQAVDPAGLNIRTQYVWDENGDLLAQVDAAGTGEASTTRFVYDKEHRLIFSINAEKEVVETGYDGDGRVIWTRAYAGRFTGTPATGMSETTVRGNVSIDAARDRVTRTMYDERGLAGFTVDGENYVTRFVYDGAGNITKTIRYEDKATGVTNATTKTDMTTQFGPHASPPGTAAVTVFAYDNANRLTSTTDAMGATESYQYDAAGNRTKLTNKLGGVINYKYDALGRLDTEHVEALIYDAGGNKVAGVDVNGTATANTVGGYIAHKYTYDDLGRVLTDTQNSNRSGARTTTFAYDALDRVTSKIVGALPAEIYQYDARGNLVQLTDASGAKTMFFHDKADRKVGAIVENYLNGSTKEGSYSAWSYDALGNLVSERAYGERVAITTTLSGLPPSGEVRETTYTYDKVGRVTQTSVAGIDWASYASSTLSTNTGVITTTIAYDAFGNVISQTDGRGNTIHSWYDLNGQEKARLDQEGYLTSWVRDSDGNVTEERRYATKYIGSVSDTPPSVSTHAADRVTTFVYDKNGRRTSETRASVAYATVNATGGTLGQTTGNATIGYTYNALGQVLTKTAANGDATTYSYDNQGRLWKEHGASFTDYQSNSVAPTTRYYYDALGQLVRTVEGKGGSGATLDTTATSDDRVTSFAYDVVGRMESQTDARLNVRNYVYDTMGRVTQESYSRTKSDGTSVAESVNYSYNAAGGITKQWMISGGTAGVATHLRYNAYGEVTGKGMTALPTDTAVYQESFEYDKAGRVWRTNSGDGVVKILFYDKAGNQTVSIVSSSADLANSGVVADIAAARTSLSSGGTSSITGAIVTITQYDNRGMAIATVEPGRILTSGGSGVTITRSRSYNAFGEVASETDGRNNTTNFSYNTMGRLTQTVRPAVKMTREDGSWLWILPQEDYYYDISGRMVGIRNANGAGSANDGYAGNNSSGPGSSAGNAASKTANAGQLTTRLLLAGTGHDAGNGATGGDALVYKEFRSDGGIARVFYDVFGDARIIRNELVNNAADANSNGIKDADEAAVQTTFDEQRGYDKLGNLTSVIHRGALLTDYYSYDSLGRRTVSWNSFQSSDTGTNWSGTDRATTDYDSLGRVTSSMAIGGDTITYGYSWNGSLATTGMGTFGGWVQITTVPGAPQAATEHMDYFGRTIDKIDHGNHNYDFTYDRAGRLTARSNNASESISYSWLNTGLQSGQTGTGGTAVYGYDKDGNRVSESFSKGGTGYRNSTATYDALGRMDTWSDTGIGGTIPASTTWDYDAQGNVRHTVSTYRSLDDQGVASGSNSTQDFWYRYDSMNRLVVDKGVLSGTAGAGGTTIVRGASGTLIAHNAAGQRISATRETWLSGIASVWVWYPGYGPPYEPGPMMPGVSGDYQEQPGSYQGTRNELYSYSADGYLTGVTYEQDGYTDNGDGTLTVDNGSTVTLTGASYTRDTIGRLTAYIEEGGRFSQSTSYDASGRVTSQTTTTVRSDGTYVSTATNTYNSAGNLDSMTSVNLKDGNDAAVADTSTSYSYDWWDGAIQNTITHDSDTGNGANALSTTTHAYDSSGLISSASISDGRARTVTFVTDMNGMIIERDEADGNTSIGDPRDIRYFMAGRQMGLVTNNGLDGATGDADFGSSVNVHTMTPAGTNSFANGVYSPAAAFASQYQAINGFDPMASGSRYSVNDGDTLQSIAAALWGDGSLWYMIAEVNGLDGSETLEAGQLLIIPNKVHNFHNSSATFRPYDPNAAIGDNSPTDPIQPAAAKPKKNKCGVVGQILLVAIAVAVTAVLTGPLSGAIGSALAGSTGQAAAAAMAFAGGSGAIGGVAGAVGAVVGGALAGAAGAIASQAFGVLTGIQNKFSWKGVAMSAISGGIGGGLGTISGLTGGSGLTGVLRGAARGALASTLTQGVAVTTGLQHRFSWSGVAIGGAVGGASALARGALGMTGEDYNPTRAQYYTDQALSGMAGAIAGAATASALKGGSFGDNLIATLPDVIGSTIGDLVADAATGRLKRPAQKAEEQVLEAASGGGSNLTASGPKYMPTGFAMFGQNPAARLLSDNPMGIESRNQLNPAGMLGDAYGRFNAAYRLASEYTDPTRTVTALRWFDTVRTMINPAQSGDRLNARVNSTLTNANWEKGLNNTSQGSMLRLPQQAFATQDPPFLSAASKITLADGSKSGLYYTRAPGGKYVPADGEQMMAVYPTNTNPLNTPNRSFAPNYRSAVFNNGVLVTPTSTSPQSKNYNGWLSGPINWVSGIVSDVKEVPGGIKQNGIGWFLDGLPPTAGGGLTSLTRGAHVGISLISSVRPVSSATSGVDNIAQEVIHGNSKLSPKPATLYELWQYGDDGVDIFLKHGISQNPATRYSKGFMEDKFFREVATGSRADMLILERQRVIQNPGPLNFEPWAVKARGGN